ncbi:glutathione S-transferase N-terminal domain-containing protein [Pseudoduganella aquatica]|uniref:Glutathione S-transferase family protein n=1 Tax=Pseudoduganella aquatica TaxID=2660641 RepID=A0A7X4H6Q0_9BURK|nr:glutathione S-transferase N-terminal domain-containing protein [Pseudoduganella aquatica]MYN05733.1 glutathione S-transferase family protein [Pseudoduganella aquatica]
MISFYTWTTPNGRKVAILLEELGLAYESISVNLGRNEQFTPGFLAISPNNKIPAIVDHGAEGGPLSVFESGAILTYLAERHGRFLPAGGAARYKTLEWLNWQMGGLGPMLGQLGYFEKFAQEKSAAASARFLAEADRLLSVMDKRLAESRYLAGDEYSIADIAAYPWAVTASTFLAEVLAERIGTKPALLRWMELVGSRPAVQRGMR